MMKAQTEADILPIIPGYPHLVAAPPAAGGSSAIHEWR